MRLGTDRKNNMKLRKIFIVSGLALLASVPALANDGISLEAGYGYHTDMARITWSREWSQRWFTDHDWSLGGYWDVALGEWHPHNPAGDNHDVTDFGLTPVWRLRPTQFYDTATPFVELAVGAHYISDHQIYHGRDMSTHFQFGDHAGIGLTLGEKHDWDIMARLQHLSNAGIKNPNPGMNFYQLRVTHWY
jgi:lipid A 3-O-deacylase